jgi:macrolide-specific efflux system membrane fusion protein
MNSKSIVPYTIGVIALIGLGVYVNHSRTQKVAPRYVTVQAAKGTLISSVSGTGNVIVDQTAKVNPSITGTVANLAINLGDQVKKGQSLFTVINDQLDVATKKSYASYLQAKQGAQNAQAQLTAAQVTATNQSQDSGQAKAQVTFDQANQQLAAAQAQLSQDQQILSTTVSTSTSIASLQAKVSSDQSSIVVAQDNVTAATIALQQSQNSASSNTQVAKQQLLAAQASVEAAQKNMEATLADYLNQQAAAAQRTIVAPISGTVTTLNVGTGDQLGSSGNSAAASAGGTVPIVISDLTTLKASVQINEVDASKVQVGQKATMTFDAIDGLSLTGKVAKIDTVGTVTQGVVSYAATINFDSIDSRVRPQMSVSTIITTQVKQDVLSVPNTAVKTSSTGSYVQVLQNGVPVQQDVQTGSVNDMDTEITSGLNEGDGVITQIISPSATKTPAAANAFPGLGGGVRVGGGSGRGGN